LFTEQNEAPVAARQDENVEAEAPPRLWHLTDEVIAQIIARSYQIADVRSRYFGNETFAITLRISNSESVFPTDNNWEAEHIFPEVTFRAGSAALNWFDGADLP
jgi:hypothetical protein